MHDSSSGSVVDRLLMTLACAAVLYVVAMVAVYGIYPGYLDHGEPIVAAAAYRMLDGAMVYPPFDGPNFTSNIYGPYSYLANGLGMAVFGGGSLTGKLAGLLALLTAVLTVWGTYRENGLRTLATALLLISGFAVLMVPYSIWNRPDPFLLAVAALAVLASQWSFPRTRWVVWLLVGVLGGIACGMKLYGPLFVAPVGFYVALRDRSILSLFIMSAAGIVAILLPFALPVFPLENYLEWFGIVAQKPTDGEMVFKALRYGAFFFLPALALLVGRFAAANGPAAALREPDTAYAGAAVVGMLICGYAASKPGAGMYYLLPFAPLSIDMAVRFMNVVPRKFLRPAAIFIGILTVVMLVTAVPVQKRIFRALEWDRTQAIENDLYSIMSRYPDRKIQMAVGDSIAGYHDTLQKTELVYSGNPYTVDFGVMAETSYLGIRLPDALVENIAGCTTDIWLVPKGERPLAIVGYYGNKVVDDSFRDAFFEAFAKSESSVYFDLWVCRKG